MTAYAIDPPIGPRGTAFLRRVQLFKAPYPLSLNVDQEQAPRAIPMIIGWWNSRRRAPPISTNS